MVHVRWTLKVAQTELNETEYQLLARYAEEHKLTMKEALRMAAQKLVLDDRVYPDDPIFKKYRATLQTGKEDQLVGRP
jgi:ribosomal protein L16/L10AE